MWPCTMHPSCQGAMATLLRAIRKLAMRDRLSMFSSEDGGAAGGSGAAAPARHEQLNAVGAGSPCFILNAASSGQLCHAAQASARERRRPLGARQAAARLPEPKSPSVLCKCAAASSSNKWPRMQAPLKWAPAAADERGGRPCGTVRIMRLQLSTLRPQPSQQLTTGPAMANTTTPSCGSEDAGADSSACRTLLHLVPELLALIAAQLDDRKDRTALATCCRPAHAAAREHADTWYGLGASVALRPLGAGAEGLGIDEAQPGAKLFRIPDEQLLARLEEQECNPLVEQASSSGQGALWCTAAEPHCCTCCPCCCRWPGGRHAWRHASASLSRAALAWQLHRQQLQRDSEDYGSFLDLGLAQLRVRGGVAPVLEALPSLAPGLTRLELIDAGLQRVPACISRLRALQQLGMACNPGLAGDAGGWAALDSLTGLTWLDLQASWMGRAGSLGPARRKSHYAPLLSPPPAGLRP